MLAARSADGAKPADNVPKWVHMVTGELLRKLPPDSGPGQDDRVRLLEGSLTRRQGNQTYGSYGSKGMPPCVGVRGQVVGR